MSEQIVPQSEDPLPLDTEDTPPYPFSTPEARDPYVVTDPRDPFVWLNTAIDTAKVRPSQSGKQLLWLIYRMNGNFPVEGNAIRNGVKWRDEISDMDEALKGLQPWDTKFVEQYTAHLTRLDAEQALSQAKRREQAAILAPETSTPPMKLYEPNAELARLAIMEHIHLINQPKS